MRLLQKVLIAFAVLVAPPAYAQLAPHNAAGVTFGHVHLSVADPAVHHKMWVEQFGGVVSTKGTFTIVKLPNMMIAFRGTAPTGGTETTALNHFGLKVPSMAAALAKWKAAGYEVQREFKGSEGFPNAFLIGPDGLRFELQEDTTIKAPIAYHLHYTVPEPAKLRDWYVDTYGLTASKSGNFEIAEAPGMRLIFAAVEGGAEGRYAGHVGRSHRLRNPQPGRVPQEGRGEGHQAERGVSRGPRDRTEHLVPDGSHWCLHRDDGGVYGVLVHGR